MSATSASPAGYAARAVAHVHSTHSDGTATVAELRAAVAAAGAQVLLLTDHDSLGAREAGEDGPGGGVLVVVGHEVSPKGAGHLLAFGTEAVVGHHGGDEAAILDGVEAGGGFAFPAHPFSQGSRMSRTIAPPHAWHAFDHPAVAGIEVWSLTTDLAESWRTPVAAVRDLLRPGRAALAGPDPAALERWDALGVERGRPLAALGGLDAHAPGLRLGGRARTIQPHGRWMGLVQTLLWLEAPLGSGGEADERLVLDALRAGRTAVAVPPLGDPATAAVWWSTPDGDVVAPGGTAPAARGTTLHVVAPPGTSVARLVDGQPAGPVEPVGQGEWPAWFPGLHRVELRREDGRGRARTWLLPSPVRFN